MVLIAMLLASALLPASAFAIGITPGRTTLDFEPGLEKDIEFTIINNDHKDMNVMLYVKTSELSDLITLYDNIVSIKSYEGFKTFKYTVKMPEEISNPGMQEIDIVAMDMPNEMGRTGHFVDATTAVVTQMMIRVPYPGKYAAVDVRVPATDGHEPVNFFVEVRNLGSENIESAQVSIDILGPTNELIETLRSNETSIGSGNWKEFKLTWDEPPNPGVYYASVTVRYDEDSGGGIARKRKEFMVGDLFIDVTDITVKNFRLGGVAKFSIQTESKWNQRIEGAYGNVKIEDSSGEYIADVKTAPVDYEPFAREELVAYWETEGVRAGDYPGMFILHYSGRKTERELMAHISPDDMTIDILGLGIGAVTAESADRSVFTTDTMILLLLVILVMMNIGWFMFFRRRRNVP